MLALSNIRPSWEAERLVHPDEAPGPAFEVSPRDTCHTGQ